MPDSVTAIQQKEQIGGIVTFVWILTGCYSFLTADGHSLFSLSALVFIFGGMFVATLFLGLTYWFLAQGIARILTWVTMRRLRRGEPIPRFFGSVEIASLFLTLEIAVTVIVARVAFRLIA